MKFMSDYVVPAGLHHASVSHKCHFIASVYSLAVEKLKDIQQITDFQNLAQELRNNGNVYFQIYNVEIK